MLRRFGSVAAALLVLASCGTAGTAPSPTSATTLPATSTSTVPEGPLPPHERSDIAAIFDPLVEPLGYRVTRAALITRTTYVVDPAGDHLAIYLAPVEDIGFDRFASDLPGIVEVFLPLVFDSWPELASFDVCQEPFDAIEETPPSQTLVDVTREAAGVVDWSDLDLATLITAGREVDGLTVWARSGVRDSVPWQEGAGT